MNKLRVCFFSFFMLLFLGGFAAPPGYSYYKLCTTQENQITVGSTTLNNFPVLVRITDVDLRSTGNGGYVQNINGFDIIYTAADGNTIIPFQLESYDALTGTVVAWVKVPVVSATVNSDFYMYFGNGSILVNQSSTATWDANYKAVYHLHANENDGTSNAFNLVNSSTTNQPAAVAADGQDIEPTQFLRYSATNGLNIAGDVTLETWINFETFRTGQFENVLFADGVNGESASQNFQYYLNYIGGGVNNNKLQAFWEFGAGTDVVTTSTVVANPGINVWHHVAMVRNAAAKTVIFYFDGIQLGTVVPYGTNPSNGGNATLQLGREHPTSTNQIDGDLDESRISNIIRIPEWMQATYQTSMPASTFVQYGPTVCLFMNVANAGPNQTICSSSPTATMAGNNPIVAGTGTWSVFSGSGTITTPNSPTTTITAIGTGVNVFRWTLSNGPCTASFSDITITVNPVPSVSNAGIDQTICASSTAFTGNSPAIGTGTWTLISGSGVITSPSSPTSTVTGLGIGANVFQWTITNPPCAASTDQVTITQNANPSVANAGSDQTVCGSSSAFAGNIPAIGSGTWTLISGVGIPTSPGSATSAVTGLGVGANTFQWTITNGVCPSSSDQVIINSDAPPTVANAGLDQTICSANSTFTGNVPGVGIGVWTLISGSGVITSPSSPTSTVTGLGIGPNVFQWTISNGICPSSTDQVTINVDQNPTISNAGPDQTICATSSAFAGNIPGIGTGVWTLISGSGVITSPSFPTSGVTGLGVGANVFQWTISNGTCPSSTDQVTITQNANPTVANAGLDQTICSGSSAFTGNNPAVGSGTWTLISGTGIPTTPSSPTSAVTGLSVGANVFQWTITNGICPSSSDQVTITRDPNPTVSNAGPDQTICATSSSFAGNIPGIGTGAWTLISGSGVITSPASPTSGVTGLGVGANVFQWTISNGTCPSSTDQVTITQNANPTIANAGSDQTICSGSSAFTGNNPAVGSGTWTLISGTGIPTTPSLPTSAVTGLSVGANVFQWTIANGVCPSSSDQVTITRDPNPTVSNAGPDQTICATSSSFAGNIPVIGTGAWTLISGSGVITSPASPTSGVTGLGVGANVFQWTISNGTCPSSTDQVTITQNANPTLANAGSDQTICSGSSVFAGNNPAVGSGTWTLISGTGIPTTPSSPTSAVTGLSVGANVFQWTITNGVCPSSSDQVTITRDPNPTVSNAGTDQNLCTSSTTMAANLPAIGTPVWTLVSGTGTITSSTSETTTITGLSVGSNVFQWTISNGTCPSSSDQVTILIDANPSAANAGPDQTICTSSTSFTGNIPTIGTGTWTLVSGTGSITTPSSASSSVTSMSVGTNVFQWTISNGTCPSSSDQVNIGVDSIPTTAAAGPDQIICSANSVFSGNTPAIGTGTWTLISGSGTPTSVSSPNSSVTGLSIGTNVFQWTISNGICPSTSDQVTINVDANPTIANAGPDQTLCSNTTSLSGNIPLVGNGLWTLVSGTGVITTPSSSTSSVTGLSVGSNVFQWTISNGTCSPSSDQVVITVDPIPSIANAGPDQTICSSVSAFAGNTPAIGTGTWTLVSGSGVITSPSSPTSGVTGLSIGANIFQWTISNGICPSNADQVTITVDANPTVANAGPDQTLCSSTATLSGNTPAVGTGTWTLISGGGVITSPASPTSSVTGLAIGANVFQWSISNGSCAASIDQITITQDANPSISNAGLDQTICSSSSVFAGNNPAVGTGTWILVSGSGIPTSPNSNTSAVTGLGIGANTFQWRIANGTCPSSSDLITINVDQNPSVANAGPDQALCSSSATLSGNIPVVGTGVWTLVSGTGTITNPLLQNTTVTSLGIGANVFQWTISNGSCSASFDQVTITQDANPSVADAGIDQTICSSSSAFTGNIPVVGTGTWSLISGGGVPSAPNSNSSAVNGLNTGANTFQWTITNGTCPASTDQVILNVDQNPTPAFAGIDQAVCSSAASMGATNVSVGTGVWTIISGTGTISLPNSASTNITGLSVGTNSFQWTTSNGTCPSSSDTVIIISDANPDVANAGPDQTLCASSSAAFNGNVPVVGNGLWTLISGSGVITLPSSATSGVTGLAAGSNIFQWTISNGVCPSTSDQVTIIIDANPTIANAGPDQTICESAGSVSLSGNLPAIGTGVWSLASGSGTITSPLSNTTTVTGLTTGTNSFVWTISNGICASSSDTVFVYVDSIPSVAVAGPDQNICGSTTSINLSANNPVTGTGIWTFVAGAGTIAFPNSNATSVSGLGIGTNSFVWTISNGACNSSTDTVAIVVDSIPTVSDAGFDQTICSSSNSVVLNGNIPSVGTGNWSLVSGTGTISNAASSSTMVTGLGFGSNLFAWTITNGVCGFSTDTVVITVDSTLQSIAGPDQSVCGTVTTINLGGNIPVNGSGIWTLASGSGTIVSPNSNATAVTGIGLGINSFVWTISSGVCAPSSDTVFIFVDSIPTISNAGFDQTVCANPGSVVLNGNIPAVGTGIWSLISGTGTISNPNSSSSAVTALGSGTNSFVWTISNGICASSVDTVVITVDSIPSTSNAGPDQFVCGSTSAVTLTANIPLTGTGLWTLVVGSGIITSPNSAVTTITGLVIGTNSFVWTISNGVCGPSVDTVNIVVDSIPSIATAGIDQTICSSVGSVVLNGNNPIIGSGNWSQILGSGSISSPALYSSAVTGLGTGTNSFVWTITSGACGSTSDTVNIFVDAAPSISVAGNMQNVCGDSAFLNAVPPTIGTGTWTLVSGAGTIGNPNSSSTSVVGLIPGNNIFQYTISNGVCPSSISNVTIHSDLPPDIAFAGIDLSVQNPVVTLNGNTPVVGNGLWTIMNGAGTFTSASNPTPTVTELATGQNEYIWTISNGVCPSSSDTVIVTFDGIDIPNGFSPNGDGINDFWVIPGIQYYQEAKLTIYNKWGNIVFRSDAYQNDFDGNNQNKQELSDDTYYYSLEISPTESYTGFIVIKRKN